MRASTAREKVTILVSFVDLSVNKLTLLDGVSEQAG
jgi:hypothetical protein